jgi:hypothetical protein
MAKDIFHEHVKEALKKDGWTVTHDPLKINHLKQPLEIDLGAEMMIGAERDAAKIAVEIKSFLSHSRIYDFHLALGQFKTYFRLLKKAEPERTLFLAIPIDAYTDFFNTPFGKEAIEEENLKIIVYNPKLKTVELWIS